jgi:hypothetical protein
MTEKLPTIATTRHEESNQIKVDIISLNRELGESHEKFSWPGLQPDSYEKIKADEEQYLGYTTPIDELIERCKAEGIKVLLGKYPESGSVFIMPAGSDDIEQDSLSPKYLVANRVMDGRLKKLIVRTQELSSSLLGLVEVPSEDSGT